MPELRLYQLEAIKEIIEKKRVLIADDMGLGKTAEAIAARNFIEKRQNRPLKTIYLCPASVMDHIEREIKLWYKKAESSTITQLHVPSYDKDIENAKNSDFTILNYHTLSYFGEKSPDKIEKLKDLGFNYGIIDEAHNAKNPISIRSATTKHIFDSLEYLSILTGTPLPNSIIDIYMLLNLLDKDAFPINNENARSTLKNFYHMFRQDPDFVRRILYDDGRMIRRTVDDYLQEKFPSLEQHKLEVELEGEHREAYIKVYENDELRPAAKLLQLRKAALDPCLIRPDLLKEDFPRNAESSVYKKLDSLLEKITDENGKAIIFSDLKKGVTDKLKERYVRYNPVVIQGGVGTKAYNGDISLREERRRIFQNDKDCRLLISTTVMDEGVDLTAATHIIHVTSPYTPASFDQRNRRVQRLGEVNKENVHSYLVSVNIDESIPSITKGIERLLDDKRRIVYYIIEQPFLITKKDLDELKNKASKSRHLSSIVRTPARVLFGHFGSLKGQGFKKIENHYEKYPEQAESIAYLYSNYWEGYYGGNTANLYAKIINILEEKETLEKKIDIASGPFSLSRKIKEPVVNTDLNNYMLQAGKRLEEKGIITPGNTAYCVPFHNSPLKNESFNFALCSLALHMSRLCINSEEEEIRERELALKEMNRVLVPRGYGLITLPYTVINESDFSTFHEGLNHLGFNVLPFSGFYLGKDSQFKVYLTALQKRENSSSEPLDFALLTWEMDRKLAIQRKSSKRETKHIFNKQKKPITKEFVEEFYSSRDGKTLEECVREGL